MREAVRVLSLRTRDYVADVSRTAHLHDADVHAVGVLLSADRDGADVTASSLARELSLSRAAVTSLIHRMEHAGHVVRERSDVDRRSVRLHPTESARSMSRQGFTQMIEDYRDALSVYDEDDLALVADALERLAGATRTRPAPLPAEGQTDPAGTHDSTVEPL